ncbi:MAG: glycosyltransferase [Verrucomicrobia bacterium]|nr:glycosyltransferase [Verrucomicrobiota bacterium]
MDGGVAARLAENTGCRVLHCPDSTDTSLANTSVWPGLIRERRKGRKVVGLLGQLAARKGLHTLLAASRCKGSENWLYLFAGSVEGEDRERIERAAEAQDNVLVIPERIELESEFNAILNECDVLFAVYPLFAHSSGLVTKAGMFKKPILVSKGFCMQEVTEAYGLGIAIDENDVDAVNLSLFELVDPRRSDLPDYDGFARDFGQDALRAFLMELIGNE